MTDGLQALADEIAVLRPREIVVPSRPECIDRFQDWRGCSFR